jgi:hypothetical protein
MLSLNSDLEMLLGYGTFPSYIPAYVQQDFIPKFSFYFNNGTYYVRSPSGSMYCSYVAALIHYYKMILY